MSSKLKQLAKYLSDNPDHIFSLLKDTSRCLNNIFSFGAVNGAVCSNLVARVSYENVSALNFPASFTLAQREIILARQYCLMMPGSGDPFDYKYIFTRGMGVCDHYSFFALLVLSRNYHFSARIERIYSDEVHTYVVLTDDSNNEYVLDLWSNAALKYENHVEWNETMPYQYRRNQDCRVETVSVYHSDELRQLDRNLLSDALINERQRHFAWISSQARFSFTPSSQFFKALPFKERTQGGSPTSVDEIAFNFS
jgi:hypothetical protein